jgi:hypothetical protein
VALVGGDLYFSSGNQVWKRSVTGSITVVAGTGASGFSGDGGPATSATFDSVGPLVRLANGTIFVADGLNHRIRKISPSGIVTTVVGTGTAGFNGDGSGPSVQLNFPRGLLLKDPTTIWITDSFNDRIRAYDLTTHNVTTILGGGSTAPANGVAASNVNFGELIDVDVTATGEPVVIERLTGRVWTVNSGVLSLSLDSLNDPRRLVRAPDGSYLVTERGGNRVWRIPVIGSPSVVAGTGDPTVVAAGPDADPATLVDLFQPWEIWADATGFWFSDDVGKLIRRVDWD